MHTFLGTANLQQQVVGLERLNACKSIVYCPLSESAV
jgi:hypothetical protein